MALGTVKFFNAPKGFGFIVPASGGQDVFCHIRELRRSGLETLSQGARVTYEVEPGKEGKGLKAVKVALVP